MISMWQMYRLSDPKIANESGIQAVAGAVVNSCNTVELWRGSDDLCDRAFVQLFAKKDEVFCEVGCQREVLECVLFIDASALSTRKNSLCRALNSRRDQDLTIECPSAQGSGRVLRASRS